MYGVLARLPVFVETATPLLKERTTLERPFTAVGVDHTAAIQTETQPGYILIVTYMASRAVHLDFCPSLEAEEFVLALRRFCATHGAPQYITSDNHQTFKTASHLLQGLYEEDEVRQFLRRTGIQWRFQTPRAPWKGGFFERLIGVTKRTLRIALGQNRVMVAIAWTIVGGGPYTRWQQGRLLCGVEVRSFQSPLPPMINSLRPRAVIDQ
ncbi:uncharacterized protein [Palaemon carinicauda]|uniref:uncharacterized protein n=1 Tax=Palaemon carinicauda TaxID=392227 RepID=UPI0035B69939